MPISQGLSPERHRAIGPELAGIHILLAGISAEIIRAWPRRSVVNDRASAVVGPVLRLQQELASRFREEHGAHYSPDVYFPLGPFPEYAPAPFSAAQHAVALKVAEARIVTEGSVSAAAREAADQALLSLGRMHAAIAVFDAGEADRAMTMAASWAETAQRESRLPARDRPGTRGEHPDGDNHR